MTKHTEPTLKDAFDELEKITQALERGASDLEQSIPQLKKGHELASFLKQKLQKIEHDIQEVTLSFDKNDRAKNSPQSAPDDDTI